MLNSGVLMIDGADMEKIDLEKVDWRGSRDFFESLGEALDKLDDKDESYDFTWVGKRKAVIEAGAPINKTFRPDVDASRNWDSTENLFIEGDNLDALKLLQESYLSKVGIIYIDPPYNTGKDFVYHDNFRANTEQYDEDTEYRDENGNAQFKKNDKSNGRYHSDWLSMMYPRLKLARNLLSEDGVIFISIDDNERANLKKLCDEVYGEDNFIIELHIQVRYAEKSLNEDNAWQPVMESVLVYAKSRNEFTPNRPFEEYDLSKFQWEIIEKAKGEVINVGNKKVTVFKDDQWDIIKHDEGRIGLLKETWASGSIVRQSGTAAEFLSKYLVERKNDDGLGALYKIDNMGEDGLGYRYVSGPKKASALRGKFYTGVPLSRIEELRDGGQSHKLKPIPNYYDYSAEFGNIRHEGGVGFNGGKKPVKLLKQLINFHTNKNLMVLDFFAGSSSTAHAVMQQNVEDGGDRKWIMVQLPEITDEKTDAFKAGYKTIPEISRERIRRAGDKIATEHPEAKVDYGFRSLLIAETNYKQVYKSAGDLQQSALLDVVDNIKDDRSELDLLFGVLTASALELNRPLETQDISGSSVYLYDYFGKASGLVACFGKSISEAAIKQIAELKPLTAVFRDSSFSDSQAKVNLAEHFRIISPETKVKVI